MITTGHLRRKAHGDPQKLQVVKIGSNPFTPTSPDPKPERDIAPGTRIGGKMLVTGGMDDRVMNHKRRMLMEKVKKLKARAIVQERIKAAQLAELTKEPPIEPVIEPPIEPSIIPDYMKEEPTIWKIPPEKKKRAYHRKKDKETK